MNPKFDDLQRGDVATDGLSYIDEMERKADIRVCCFNKPQGSVSFLMRF